MQSFRVSGADGRADERRLKSSLQNEGTSGLTTNCIGIRHQAERGADECASAVGGQRRVVGARRAAVAEGRAEVQVPGSEAVVGSAGAVRDLVRAAYGNSVDALAAGARLRLRVHLLAQVGGVAAGWPVGEAARAVAGETTGGG